MHGIIFAYNTNIRLKELTEHRTVSSIPFGGRYRVIDFMLSNMVNSGILDVGVIMRENYQSLLDHLGSGKDWDLSRKRGGLWLLPPFGLTNSKGESGYRGKMDALSHVMAYIQHVRYPYVVLADGDLVTNIDLNPVLAHHKETGADITAVCTPKHIGLPQESTYLTFGRGGFVTDVVISPAKPEGCETLGIYIMETSMLEKLVSYCATRNLFSFEVDVLQKMAGTLKVSGFIHHAYASRMQSTAAYFHESMQLLKGEVRDALFVPERTVRTKVRDEASSYYSPTARVGNCIVADGCYIEGDVENSVLFRGVTVEKGARVENSILMQDTRVCGGAHLNYAITDKNVVINEARMMMGHASYPIAIAKDTVV
ncbi:glucose-1-phosphate adenylyltransferase subunit GlgD [Oscillospiraceae bacterium OttesenSCG-928-F05]|nr:glucose-1-phosphate adenylyltransferase subunit GlgD [Oscillospiraceae bacterium OttesenSCG-928-F05]